jgi:hypothetical protein
LFLIKLHFAEMEAGGCSSIAGLAYLPRLWSV